MILLYDDNDENDDDDDNDDNDDSEDSDDGDDNDADDGDDDNDDKIQSSSRAHFCRFVSNVSGGGGICRCKATQQKSTGAETS